ncbi:hypothetical protein [Okeania hirsuta]|uniref:hypothetical protein n=1 Tax=Okeania hirsuta TaxID=1458930 RepID=UPI000F538421|nr:hypothetical protein [Okeania hirsuta]RQH12615.1 hypothetical protein D4Z78_25250 [Okeania hirsuta]
MGMTSIIYGVIEEYGLNLKKLEEVYAHNEGIISALPTSDSWPPLSKEMFSITKNDSELKGPNLEYWGRMIHFAACLKSVEYEWREWKEKFEDLLLQMYWTQAHVHVKTEYSDIISFSWTLDLKKWSISEEAIRPIKREFWDFEDADNWER